MYGLLGLFPGTYLTLLGCSRTQWLGPWRWWWGFRYGTLGMKAREQVIGQVILGRWCMGTDEFLHGLFIGMDSWLGISVTHCTEKE